MWKLRLQDTPVVWNLLSQLSESRHINIISESNYSDNETYYMISPHLETLRYPEDSIIAKYRAEALLLILNTSLKLTENYNSLRAGNSVVPSIQLYFEHPSGAASECNGYNEPSVHLEQFDNPFIQLEPLKHPLVLNNRISKIIELSYQDELVKEVLLLFGLISYHYLFILINVYKIAETIEYDLRNIASDHTIDTILNNKMTQALKPFQNGGKIRHYMNTRTGSGSLQSRHGANDNTYKKSKPSIHEIYDSAINLINTWIDVKKEVLGI